MLIFGEKQENEFSSYEDFALTSLNQGLHFWWFSTLFQGWKLGAIFCEDKLGYFMLSNLCKISLKCIIFCVVCCKKGLQLGELITNISRYFSAKINKLRKYINLHSYLILPPQIYRNVTLGTVSFNCVKPEMSLLTTSHGTNAWKWH